MAEQHGDLNFRHVQQQMAFQSLLSCLGEDIKMTQVKHIKKALRGHVSKEVLYLVNTGHDLMFALINLKLLNPWKLAFLRKLLRGVEDGGMLLGKIEEYKLLTSQCDEDVGLQEKLMTLQIIEDRQSITLEEYKNRLERIVIDYNSIQQHRRNLIRSIKDTKKLLTDQQKTEQDAKWDMAAVRKVRDEKESKRRKEVMTLGQLISERQILKTAIENSNADLNRKGKLRLNTFDRSFTKSEMVKNTRTVNGLNKKITAQEERVKIIEKDVELFSDERSTRREHLQVIESKVHKTVESLSKIYEELEEINENLLVAMERLHLSQEELDKIEDQMKLNREDARSAYENRHVIRKERNVELTEVHEILQGKPKLANYSLLGSKSFIIKPPGCKLPVALAITTTGDLLIADQGNNRLLLISIDGKIKTKIDLDTLSPIDIAINPRNNNYIVIGEREIRIYKNEYLLRKFLPHFVAEEMYMPMLVSVSVNLEDEEIYILDKANLSIQVFQIDGTHQHSQSISEYVTSPCRIEFLKGKTFLITDDGEHNITIFNSERLHENKVFGSPGYGFGEYICPTGVGSDSEGNIIIADAGNHRIHVANKDGGHVATYGRFGRDLGNLNNPCDVTFHENGFVVVADTNNNRIVVYIS